ncbi:MAG TPA: SMP-30/gluconolactonase/LRE family protein [Fibrobacteria bacterium]|nr:SMP-30/gluconolactonase/LRE family protein [Fibrobacteria bacterium]
MNRLPHLLASAALSLLAAAPHGTAQTVIDLPDSLYYPGDTVTWVKRVPSYCEGPAWHARTGEVTFTQIGSPGTPTNRPHWPLWRVKPGEDTGSVFWNLGQGNGQKVDPHGRLVVVQRDVVIRFSAYDTLTAKVDTLVASGKDGVSFNADNNTDGGAGNDLSIGSRGDFYFSNLATNAYYVDTAGNLSVAATGLNSANGIFWLEEENAVYVHSSATIYRFDRDANGALTNRTTWTTLSGYADGGCIDSQGHRWIGDYQNGMIKVYTPGGQLIGNIALRSVSGAYNARSGNAGNANNCTFGGPDLKTLYITGDGGLYSLRVKIPGRPPAQAPPVSIKALVPQHKPRQGGMGAGELRRAYDVRGRTTGAGVSGAIVNPASGHRE